MDEDEQPTTPRRRASDLHPTLPVSVDSLLVITDLVTSLTALRTEIVVERDRWRRQRRWPLALAALSLLIAGIVGYEAIERRSEYCAGRQVLRNVVVAATTSPGLDFAAVPGFGELDPETRRYLLALGELTGDDGDASDRLLDLIPAC